MCINCVIHQEQEEDERCIFFAWPPSLRIHLSGFSRRKQASKEGKDDQEPQTDLAQEDPSEDERGIEAVEPKPEPVPSARDEFHQAYTRKLQAADKDIDNHLRSLDSVSYPVSSRFPSPPDYFPHTPLSLLGFAIFSYHPATR